MPSFGATQVQDPAVEYKYPAIPDPGESQEELLATVRALKEAVALLTGQLAGGRGRAIRPADLGTVLGTTGREVLRAVEGDFSILDYANTRLQEVFTTDLAAATVEVNNAIAQAQAEFTELIDDEVAGRQAAVATEAATRQNEDESLAGQITQVVASNAGNAAAISAEAISRATGDSALATTVTSVTAVASRQRVFTQASTPSPSPGASEDAIWIDTGHGNLIKTWNGSTWVANDDARIAASVAAISAETTARANADGAITLVTNAQTTAIANVSASITDADYTRSDKFTAISGRIDTVAAAAASAAASVTTEAGARAAADEALSGVINSVSARTNAGTASGFYRLVAISATMGGVAAEFAVEVSADGSNFARAGMRIQVLGSGASRVLIEAAQFIVGTGGSSPFVISGDQLYWGGVINGNVIIANSINGNSIIANTLNANRLTAGSITSDLLAAGAITADKIGAGEITTGKLTADAAVYSRAFVGTNTGTFIMSGTTTQEIDLINTTVNIGASNPLLIIASIDGSAPPDYVADVISSRVLVDGVYYGTIFSVTKPGSNVSSSDVLFNFSGSTVVPSGLGVGPHTLRVTLKSFPQIANGAPRPVTVTRATAAVFEARNASGS